MLPWLEQLVSEWRTRVAHGRVPHALLLLGSRGVGKRAAAAWLAREQLGLDGHAEGPVYPFDLPEHADLRWVAPPEDKHTIGIEQVRDLVAELSLTSYAGGGKVAVLEPANAMTTNAANSLLKTLEEPPGDALLILIADRVGRLPATIMSRCQRIRVALPPASMSLDWLDRWHPGSDWRAALELAGMAPLGAIEARERLGEAEAMHDEWLAVAGGRASPVDVAARWSKLETQFVLDWLCRTVQQGIRVTLTGASVTSTPTALDSVLRRIDRRNMFCYLDTINRLRGQAAGSFNVQLTLESLLIDWAGGLEHCHRTYSPGTELPVTAQG